MTTSTLRVALVVCTLLVASLSASVAASSPPDTTQNGSTITIEHEGDAVTVANDTSQVISGTADFRVGTELAVMVRSTGDTNPQFLQSTDAVVTENGTWAAGFDFEQHTAGDTFSVTVKTENGSHSTELDGEIINCAGDCSEEVPDSPTPRPEQTATEAASTASVDLSKRIVPVRQSDVAAVEVVYIGTDAATVRFGDRNATGYELTVSVRDIDGDGQATIYVDTALAGREGRTVSASTDDTVTVVSESALSSSLAVGNYDISAYAGNGTEGTPDAVGSIVVESANGTPTTSAMPTMEPAGMGLDQSVLTIIFCGAFLLGGAGLAVVLLRD